MTNQANRDTSTIEKEKQEKERLEKEKQQQASKTTKSTNDKDAAQSGHTKTQGSQQHMAGVGGKENKR